MNSEIKKIAKRIFYANWGDDRACAKIDRRIAKLKVVWVPKGISAKDIDAKINEAYTELCIKAGKWSPPSEDEEWVTF